ncbi:11360_t:CDS:2 [Scutellospora calospora]|uniref:11360_t:CDS:1 n=1 Tax=Scutellospora calospora TaxID=85575 RepID=A0ACA9KL26_9GLOM|nr:11360_t:CDS:2 [Scutellospora calospora]
MPSYPNYEISYPVISDDEFTNIPQNTEENKDSNNVINYYDVQNSIKTDDSNNEFTGDMEKNSSQHKKVISKDAIKWYKNSIAVLTAFRTNFLLIFLPPAFIMKKLQLDELLVFVFNFLAIIPLSQIMTAAIDDFATRLPPAYGVVLHACAVNFVELVVLGYTLMDRNYSIVRSSLLGAILCNILLILGIVFLAGSWPRKKSRRQSKNAYITTRLWVSTGTSTLALAVLALVTPAAFKLAAPTGTGIECDIQNISHGTAIILFLVYIALLVFQLKTHAHEAFNTKEHISKEAKYFLIFDVLLNLVTSIEHIAHKFQLGNSFVGMVLIPLCVVSNFMEHYYAIKEASEDKVDTAVSLVLNTSVQIALLITPILVLVGWITSRPLTLDFNMLEISVLACAVLIMSYIMIAIVFFYLPNTPDLPENLNCHPWSRNLPPENSNLLQIDVLSS